MVAMLDNPVPGPGALERMCRPYRAPLLRFARSEDRLEIGPLFYSDYTACYACFAAAIGRWAGRTAPARWMARRICSRRWSPRGSWQPWPVDPDGVVVLTYRSAASTVGQT